MEAFVPITVSLFLTIYGILTIFIPRTITKHTLQWKATTVYTLRRTNRASFNGRSMVRQILGATGVAKRPIE